MKVWINVENGVFGYDIDDIMMVELADGTPVTDLLKLGPGGRQALAKIQGVPLRMLGCGDYHETT
jgi:hypothetical protein